MMKKSKRGYLALVVCILFAILLQATNVFAATKTLGVVSVREGGYRI